MLPVMPLTDREYHIVELHNVRLTDEVLDWLKASCGPAGKGSWFLNHPNLYFANERDHLMFVLRWS